MDSDAERSFALLERMAGALKTTNFEGTFVYQFGDVLSAMHIVHYYNNGVSQESLLTLNGPVRTMGRSGGAVACLLSGGQSVLLNRARRDGTPGPPHQILPPDWRQLAAHYRFSLLEKTRVAGRAADVVDVMPRDDLRYGYRFSIDRETALPLRTALIDEQGHPIQQLMFTDVHLRSNKEGESAAGLNGVAAADSAQATPSPAINSKPAAASLADAPGTAIQARSRWHFGQLPAGFALYAHEWIESDSDAPVEYFLFSDGLASISIYVEPGDQAGLLGQTQMAAIHAAGKRVADHQITAVGEVPPTTLAALLDAIDAGPDQPLTDQAPLDSSGSVEDRPVPSASDAGEGRQELP
ncbi:MucB/RseB C-terminal domain-containing protein [Thiorhodovibrio frisius]|uniref:MucB/RseB C-terminal domain-containing protein n=1 Tax=Thiorhodovibrio frisius TaxID=631362 RepID=UPI0002DA1259|nr:MucB/RseB C-terminal domain-containing protein [Thiorhodovibrio frisius]